MKKCPFCGADIEESARFCLYCMQSLTEKEQILPYQKKKPQCLIIIAAIVITLLMLAVVWFIRQIALGNGTPSDTSSVTESAHTPAAVVIEKHIDSSCTETGSYDEVVYCSMCNEEISRTQKTVDKKPHDHSQQVTTTEYLKTEATCTESAIYFYSCACGAKGTITFTSGDTLEHTFDQKNSTSTYCKSTATCTEAAIYYYSCVCGAKGNTTFTDGEANGHTYASRWEKDATHHWHKATCEHITEKSGEAEHNYGTDNICDTCEYDRTVNVSGVTLNFSSLAMTIDDVKTLTATIAPNKATNQNVTWTTSNASVVTVDTNGNITAVGVGTATITVTTADGNKTAQCTIVVSANGCPHTATRIERENEVDSTCKVTGSYDEVVYCSECQEKISRTQKTIEKKPHDHSQQVTTTEYLKTEATCTDSAVYYYSCICGEKGSTTFTSGTVVPHSFGNWIVDSIATCIKTGTRYHICTICQYPVSETYSDPNAHNYDTAWTVDDINHWRICSKCNSITLKETHIINDSGKCSLCGHQITVSDGGIVYMISEDGTYAEVVDYTGTETQIIIAAEYKGVPVTKIGDSAFQGKNITSIDIPNSITSIGDYAFNFCSLTDITIPDSVTSIGDYAFNFCSLTDITIPDSVTSIGSGAFANNSSLANVKIGNGVTVISSGTFSGCSKLANITIPDSITTVGGGAFGGCDNVIEKVNGVTYVKEIVMDVDDAVTVELREGTKIIAESAFSGCSKLRKVIMPDSVTVIGYAAFSWCQNLESVTMSDNLKHIGDFAFDSCTGLTSIVIPDSVTHIGDSAFQLCTGLTSIVISDSVTHIGKSAFQSTGLTSIEYRGTETQWASIFKGENWDPYTDYTITYNYTGE